MQLLIFTINGYKYALKNEYIKQLIRRQKIQPSNSTTKYLAGRTIVRDDIYTCLDLCGILFDVRAKYSKDQVFILTESKIAYIVDNVDTVLDIEDNSIQKPNIQIQTKQTIDGFFKYKDDIVILLNYIRLNE